jgi:hypothetical protein
MKTWLAILVVAIGGFACNRQTAPPTAPSVPIPPAPLATPLIRGVLRETNGGPIPGIAVWLFRYPVKTPEVVSDASGSFVIPSSRDVCEIGAVVNLLVGDVNHWYKPTFAPACTTAPNPPEASLLLKGQPILELKVGSRIATTLSNDDIDWIFPNDPEEYQCGPCKEVRVTLPPAGPALLHVRWTGSDPIHLWLQGLNDDYENVKLAELVPVPGEQAMTMVLPTSFWKVYPWLLYVGLPPGARDNGGFLATETVELTLESVPQ